MCKCPYQYSAIDSISIINSNLLWQGTYFFVDNIAKTTLNSSVFGDAAAFLCELHKSYKY